MALIKVRYFGRLRELAKKREEMVEIPDSAGLEELVKRVAELHGQKFEDYVFVKGKRLKDGFAYAVNGDTIDANDFYKLKCYVVKEFAILPPISGGSF